jgi:phosphate-selective porin OprO and OprP
VFGPFNFQGEYMRADVNRFNGGSNLDFDGAYFYVSWFLTGELRNYKAKSGEFKHTKPLKNFGEYGNGGLQASLRFSFIDLNDGNVQGGKENNVALGLNWILNPMLRLMTNYIFVDAQTTTGDDNPRILSFRGQLRF